MYQMSQTNRCHFVALPFRTLHVGQAVDRAKVDPSFANLTVQAVLKLNIASEGPLQPSEEPLLLLWNSIESPRSGSIPAALSEAASARIDIHCGASLESCFISVVLSSEPLRSGVTVSRYVKMCFRDRSAERRP